MQHLSTLIPTTGGITACVTGTFSQNKKLVDEKPKIFEFAEITMIWQQNYIRKVSFNPTECVRIYTSNLRRNLSSAYYRGLIRKCSEAQKRLFDILSKATGNGIIPLNDEMEGDPLKINNPNVGWDEDESPIDFLHIIKTTPIDIWKVVEVLERFVLEHEDCDQAVTLSLEDIRSFQGFLTVRISNTPIVRPSITAQQICSETFMPKINQISPQSSPEITPTSTLELVETELDDLLSSVDNFCIGTEFFEL
jgi:hypothetical protein